LQITYDIRSITNAMQSIATAVCDQPVIARIIEKRVATANSFQDLILCAARHNMRLLARW
tara:strand:+ start:310 stop:489 length:180 start_codon:yes stop_codon:yes gene_type:complete